MGWALLDYSGSALVHRRLRGNTYDLPCPYPDGSLVAPDGRPGNDAVVLVLTLPFD